MNILAFDTSSEILSLSLKAGESIWQTDINAGSRHSELLMDWTDKLMKAAELEPGELNLVAGMKGPGSFTGLRIGYAAAKGLSLALGIPFLAIPTLDCIASAHSVWPGIVLAVMDAKRSCFYAAFYRNGKKLTEYLDANTETLVLTSNTLKTVPQEPVLVTGPGAELFIAGTRNESENSSVDFSGFSKDPFFNRGRSLEILLYIEILQTSKECDIMDLKEEVHSGPLYIRKSDAEINLKN